MSELFFLDRQPLPIFLPSCSSCCQAEASGAPASGSGVPSTGPSTATGRPRCVMMYRTLRSRTRRTISDARIFSSRMPASGTVHHQHNVVPFVTTILHRAWDSQVDARRLPPHRNECAHPLITQEQSAPGQYADIDREQRVAEERAADTKVGRHRPTQIARQQDGTQD